MKLLTAIVCALMSGAQDKVDNPDYLGWSAFKVGSSVKFHQMSDVGGVKTESDITHLLVDLTDRKAVVEVITFTQRTEQPRETREIPAQISKDDPRLAPPLKQGEEDIQIAGKKIRCRWTETVEGVNTRIRTWTSAEVPGGLVRRDTRTQGEKPTLILLEAVEVKPKS